MPFSRNVTQPFGTQRPLRLFILPVTTSVPAMPMRTTPVPFPPVLLPLVTPLVPIFVPEPLSVPLRRAGKLPPPVKVWLFSWLGSEEGEELKEPFVTIPLPLLKAGFFLTVSGGLRVMSKRPMIPLRGLADRGEPLLSTCWRCEGESGASQTQCRTTCVLLFSAF